MKSYRKLAKNSNLIEIDAPPMVGQKRNREEIDQPIAANDNRNSGNSSRKKRLSAAERKERLEESEMQLEQAKNRCAKHGDLAIYGQEMEGLLAQWRQKQTLCGLCHGAGHEVRTCPWSEKLIVAAGVAEPRMVSYIYYIRSLSWTELYRKLCN